MSIGTHYKPLPSNGRRFSDIYAPNEVANHGSPPVWPSYCTRGWLPDPTRLAPNIPYASRSPHGSVLGLSGTYGPEPVWDADHHPSPSTTGTSDLTNLPSLHEGEILAGTPGPHSVHASSPPHALEGAAHQIITETVLFPGHGPNFARDVSLLEHQRTCCASGEEVTATCEYPSLDARDNDVPPRLVTDNTNGYNRDWSPRDGIAFNGFLRDETEVLCQWVENATVCNDRVKGKDFTAHLHHKHGTKSNSQTYSCRWYSCPVSRSMMKSSLERHMIEQHCPVKWACPTCIMTFTRKTTLIGHFERCPGRV